MGGKQPTKPELAQMAVKVNLVNQLRGDVNNGTKKDRR